MFLKNHYDSQYAQKNFSAGIPLLGALFSIFGPILDIFLSVLRNLKHPLDIFHKCLYITVVVTELKKVFDLFLL